MEQLVNIASKGKKPFYLDLSSVTSLTIDEGNIPNSNQTREILIVREFNGKKRRFNIPVLDHDIDIDSVADYAQKSGVKLIKISGYSSDYGYQHGQTHYVSPAEVNSIIFNKDSNGDYTLEIRYDPHQIIYCDRFPQEKLDTLIQEIENATGNDLLLLKDKDLFLDLDQHEARLGIDGNKSIYIATNKIASVQNRTLTSSLVKPSSIEIKFVDRSSYTLDLDTNLKEEEIKKIEQAVTKSKSETFTRYFSTHAGIQTLISLKRNSARLGDLFVKYLSQKAGLTKIDTENTDRIDEETIVYKGALYVRANSIETVFTKDLNETAEQPFQTIIQVNADKTVPENHRVSFSNEAERNTNLQKTMLRLNKVRNGQARKRQRNSKIRIIR